MAVESSPTDFSSMQRGQAPASHGYGFGLSKERPSVEQGYGFGLSKQRPAGEHGYGFGLSKERPVAEPGYGFGLTRQRPSASPGYGFGVNRERPFVVGERRQQNNHHSGSLKNKVGHLFGKGKDGSVSEDRLPLTAEK